jgi:UDP-N-acetylglucosamine 2-epimerase (non-hydrolysing)/GDP/UDP-N,N'-diacetylbacillosamine 2-epimerase (hydrolysing)
MDNSSRHICFFTGKRGGFTHLIPILERLQETDKMESSVIAADMHLSDTFGKTVCEVEKWCKNIHRVHTMLHSGDKVARAKSIGVGIISLSELLERIRPDLVFALGDRGEVLGFVIAAMELNIPIAHLFGGDVTQGGVDEPVRHAITKLSNIHLTSNEESANRVRKMGEEPWRVHHVGSPVLDLIRAKRFSTPEQVERRFELDLTKPIILLLQHSVTWQVEDAERQIRESLEAIDSLGFQTVAVYPCSDPGFEAVIGVLEAYRTKPYFSLYKNIDFADFWGLMNVASVLVGNSSAGVMETASFRLPCVNVGIRQEGRLRADNVMDVGHDRDQIVEAIRKAVHDEDFKANVNKMVSPYGDGRAAERIVSVLKNVRIDDTLLRKRLVF